MISDFFDPEMRKNKRMNDEDKNLEFSSSEHQLLCTELKQLYMVITRAKSKLCFYDSTEKNRKSIERLWANENVITHSLEESGLIVKTSTQQEWQDQGVMYVMLNI